MHKGSAMPPPPPIDRPLKQKKKEREKENVSLKLSLFIAMLEKIEKRTTVGNWSMPLHKLPLIMVSNLQEKCRFQTQILKKSPSHTLPPLGRFAPLGFGSPRWQILAVPPSLSKLRCTRGTCPRPLDWSKIIFEKKRGVGDWYILLHNNQPPNNAIQCARNVVFMHKFSKNCTTVGVGNPLHTLPPLGHFASLALAPRWQILAAPLLLE